MAALVIEPGAAKPFGSSCEVLVRRCKEIVERQGVPSGGLLRASEIHLADEPKPDGRVACRSEASLLRDAVQAADDPFLGWSIGAIELRDLGLCGFMALNAPDVRAALTSIVEMGQLLSDDGQYALHVENGEATLARTLSTGSCLDQVSLSFFLGILRELIGPDFAATRAALPNQGPDSLARLSRRAGLPVVTAPTPMTFVSFPERYLDRSIQGADAMLARTLRRLWREEQDRIRERARLYQTLQEAILPLLPAGEPKADRVAEALDISSRELKLQLDSLGTSLAAMVDTIRASLVDRLLAEPGMSPERAARSLGYRTSAALTRARRRWGHIVVADRDDGLALAA